MTLLGSSGHCVEIAKQVAQATETPVKLIRIDTLGTAG